MGIQNQKLTIEGAVTYSRLFDALKGMYEVDDDDSVWEIFNQADDQIEEVVNALKLLSAPPAPVDDLVMQVRRLVHALKKSNPDSQLISQVSDYMQRSGYWQATDCLRSVAE